MTPSDDTRPLTDEQALRLIGLARDGRPVDAAELARAEAHAAAHPHVAAELADLAAISEVLASEPAPVASADFTERVLAARARPDAGAGRILTLARRLSAAAALLLVVTVGSDLASPDRAVADPDVQDQPHAVDAFGNDPFAADDLDAGLRALLPDPARRGSDAAHAELAADDEPDEDGTDR